VSEIARNSHFRKLDALEYLSSYSHRGTYYTLQSIASFDEQGLWSWRAIWFSCFGNRLDTAEAFLNRSTAGYAAGELSAALALFLATLDERQRRLYAGLEALKIGHRGDEHIAEFFGLDRHTVARGRQELLGDSELPEGVRRNRSALRLTTPPGSATLSAG
jgi:hypothetical protein